MIVYRIEHKLTGNGPSMEGLDISYSIPSILSDDILIKEIDKKKLNHYVFGTLSETQLIKIYNESLKDLKDFVICVYEVNPKYVAWGDFQCVFVKPKANLLRSFNFILYNLYFR